MQSDEGQVFLGLVEGGRMTRCQVNLASGQTTLSIDGLDDFAPVASSSMKGPGKHRLRFANVDDQLVVWVNNTPLEFSQSTAYPELNNHRPTVEDLTPVRIRRPWCNAPFGASARRPRHLLHRHAPRAALQRLPA